MLSARCAEGLELVVLFHLDIQYRTVSVYILTSGSIETLPRSLHTPCTVIHLTRFKPSSAPNPPSPT